MAQLLSNTTLIKLQTTYLDDYDENKQFYRILFRPSVALQARELTQLQTILQNQITVFGSHTFKDGTTIDGCAVTYLDSVPFVRLLNDFNTNPGNLAFSAIDSTYLITNSRELVPTDNTAVRAFVLIANSGFIANYPNTNCFYLDYIKTGKITQGGAQQSTFASGDQLFIYDSTQDHAGTLDATKIIATINVATQNSTVTSISGNGYGISVSDGYIYQKGFFLSAEKQTILVKPFDQSPNGYVVGYETKELFVDQYQDESLNDNASGFNNYNAPGAHRLKLVPSLVAKLKSDLANNINFFAIAEFDGDKPTEQHTDTVYNKLGDEFARRTYDTSGDFTIKPFIIDTKPSSNVETFYYEVSPGHAYVKGYSVEKIGTMNIEVDRATTTNSISQKVLTANYGNYLICDNVVGAADFDVEGPVGLYDTPQYGIALFRSSSAAAQGNKIGDANIRALLWYDGSKGTATAQYYVYLSNIVMENGYSFNDDVKSFFGDGNYGSFMGDIVLVNDKAILTDTKQNNLIFSPGIENLKTLYTGAATQTLYTFRETITSTIANTTGVAIFNINSAATGGNEALDYSLGLLDTKQRNDLNFIIGANTYTTDLNGLITVNENNHEVFGVSTAFRSQLKSGSIIRMYGGTAYYTVNTVYSDTYLDIVESPFNTYSSNTYSLFYPAGSIWDTSNATVTVTSDSSLTLDTKTQFNTDSCPMWAQVKITRSNAKPLLKDINKNRMVKIDCSTNDAGSEGPWELGIVDVLKLDSVYVNASYANTGSDVKSWFVLDNGQRDSEYTTAKLTIRPEYADNITNNSKILVYLDHFTANTTAATAGVGFFSVDSYPKSNTVTDTTIGWADIPVYQSKLSGTIGLRDAIDFRPYRINTADSIANTDPANTMVTVNPTKPTAEFDTSGVNTYLPEPDTDFISDYTQYLGRIDVITINTAGDMTVTKGVPSKKPLVPFIDNDVTAIGSAFVPAFPSLTTREAESYPGSTFRVMARTISNRGYTMRDIGAIESRIKRLEYYTVLNVLEQNAKDLKIPDSSGFNRFKNGIFADNFASNELQNVADYENKIAIDKDKNIGRPYFKKHPVDFILDTNRLSSVKKTGTLVTLPFTEELYISQPFSTKIRNCTEAFWKFNGTLNLYPSVDYFQDETTTPNEPITLDFAQPWKDFANSPFNTFYGDWRTTSSSSSKGVIDPSTLTEAEKAAATYVGWRGPVGRVFWTYEGTVTTNNQERTVAELQVDTSSKSYDFGTYVSDFSIQPYMRTRTVAVEATGLKPNTRVYCFFDDTNVSDYVAPAVYTDSTKLASDYADGKENQYLTQKGGLGNTLTTDANGIFLGIFKIPANTFRVGDRKFTVCDVPNIVDDAESMITSASAMYSASNISVTKKSQKVNVTTPTVKFNTKSTEKRTTQTVTNVTYGYYDPISESFFANANEDAASGFYITSVGVYFKTKDPSLGVTLYIMELTNGFPDLSRVLGSVNLKNSQINVATSDTEQVETKFTLTSPIFLSNSGKYVFMVQPEQNSPNFQIYTARSGGIDFSSGNQVYSDPYVGTCFISANRITWTPLQKEDLKFNIYRAKFSSSSGTAYFVNDADEFIVVDGFNRKSATNAIEVNDVVYSGNFTTVNISTSYGTPPFGIVRGVDEGNGTIVIEKSTGGFTSSTTANNTLWIYRVEDPSNTSLITYENLVATANVTKLDKIKYTAVVPQFNFIQPQKTGVYMGFKGMDDQYVMDNSYSSVKLGNEVEFIDKERYVYSYSTEVAVDSGNSAEFAITMTVDTGSYISPAIDLSRKASLFVENIINNNATNEHLKSGKAATKYVSKTVVLADGQEAQDLQVYVSAFRPSGTDVLVYAKLLQQTDPEDFDSKVWTQLSYLNGSGDIYSQSANPENYIEYQYGFPSSPPVTHGAFINADNYNEVEYTSNSGARMVGFKYFAIKIVLLATDTVTVPRIHDLRAVAMQV
jgi:hypothetical protein